MFEPLCLIVDDEPDLRDLSVMTLTPMGIECRTAENLAQAKNYLQSESFDLCLTDMRLPDGNGIELVKYINQHYPHTPVAMITAYSNVESAVQALQAGAFDYIAKPIEVPKLRSVVEMAFKQRGRSLSEEEKPSSSSEKITSKLIGQSKVMQDLRATIEKLARSQAPIYIRGESGTGKEVVARMIHDLGARADGPFIPVNCGAIPSELMESEFFGYKKGSFTGAQGDKPGLFQAAERGTLFLDEVAELPILMQVKLLRAIQEKQVRPVGSPKEIPVDVRILSATHRNLAELVKQGKFRQDLFYRLNVIEVYVPPLRERPEDIPLLADKILSDLSKEMIMEDSSYQQPGLSEKAKMALRGYYFSGNVRELENLLERAMTLCEDNLIRAENLQLSPNSPYWSPLVLKERGSSKLDPFLDVVEKETILNALDQMQGNKTKAAKLLGISFGALRYRLQKLKLEPKEKEKEKE
jgi:two-component system response regulator PilR (NtrC family)